MNDTDLRKKIVGLLGHVKCSNQLKTIGNIKKTDIEIRPHGFDVIITLCQKTLVCVYLNELNKFTEFVYELFENRAQLKGRYIDGTDVLIIPNSTTELKIVFYFRR